MASFNLAPPEKFSFKQEEWPKWIRRFEHFRVASELNKKPENTQISTLIYSMGDEADDILNSFTMSDDDREKYDAVKAKFEGHFIIKRNVIFERAKFNLRVQKEGESADNFITDLYTLAEHCQFGALHDELIRDRIVVGLRNKALSEKLQLESSLTLEKAINQARQKELIRQQQELLGLRRALLMLIELMSKDKINSLYLSKSSIQSLINQLLTKIVVDVVDHHIRE